MFLFTFFSTAGSHFHLGGPLAFSLILLPPLQNFHLAVPIALFFLSLALALSRFFLVELRWLVAYFLFFSVFLFLYFLICGHEN